MLVIQCVRRLALLVLLGAAAPVWAAADEDRWGSGLRAEYFQDRAITASKEVIALEAPYRAEDAAIVPLRIRAGIEQTEGRYIKTVTLLIDNNPEPLVGRFHFTPRSGRADLALRVRVNAYSPVRVIAETSDGELHMDEAYVKASGGCSAPVGTDLEAAMKRLGRMKFRVKGPDLEQPLQTQLGVSHPNITGVLIILLLLLTIIVWLSVKPVNLNEVITSTPASNYEEALNRIEAVQAVEAANGDLNPVCLSKLMTHGERTENAIVFLHGFTSCPEQFEQLGEAFFNQGYNVYIPRLPGHGRRRHSHWSRACTPCGSGHPNRPARGTGSGAARTPS